MFTVAEMTRYMQMSAEISRQSCESLNFYEPLQEQEDFHKSKARERLVRGSNRAGKTLCAAIELARAVTGRDPHKKYPATDGIASCLGTDLKHIGLIIYPKLFKAGAFQMIRDERTGMWRAFLPWKTWDRAHAHLKKPAPPLIPQRFIKSIAWENKKENIPSMVQLTTGWQITFHSSEGKATQGNAFHLAWIDEEVLDPSWYEEFSRGLMDFGGSLVWSATPQAATEQLYDLHLRADQCKEAGRTDAVEEFALFLHSNPHISDQEKQYFIDKFANNDEQTAVRVMGGYAIESRKVFPEFGSNVHGIRSFPIPPSWTKYAVVDPGRQVCAVLFAAVPPPDQEEQVVLFDELYIRECDAEKFGLAMARRTAGMIFYAFIIDSRSARTREIGSGRQLQQQYSDALERHKVSSVTTGHDFLWGTTDVDGSLEAVRGLLRIGHNGKPKLRYFKDVLVNFEREIKGWFLTRERVGHTSRTTDKPAKGNDHLMDNLRYLAAYDPQWHEQKRLASKYGIPAMLARKRQRQNQRRGGEESYISLGPTK